MAPDLELGLTSQIVHAASKAQADYLHKRGQIPHDWDTLSPINKAYILEAHLEIWKPVLDIVAGAISDAKADVEVNQMRVEMLAAELEQGDTTERNIAGRLKLLFDEK